MNHRFTNILLGVAVLAALVGTVYFLVMPDDLEQQRGNEIKLQLQWIPTSQFLGVYAAIHEGYFSDEGLKVELLHGGPNVDPLRRLVDGECSIALATADQVVRVDAELRAKSTPSASGLRALGTVFSRSVAVFTGHSLTAPTSLDSLRQKRIGVYPTYDSDHILSVLLAKAGVSRDDIHVVAFPALASWFDEELDYFPSYLFNEPVEIQSRGVRHSILDPEDFGVRFYSDTVVVTEEFYRTHEEAVSRFMRALRNGWASAAANPDNAVAMMISLERPAIVGRGGEKEINIEGIKAKEVVRYLAQGDQLLNIDRGRWLGMVRDLAAIGVVDSLYDPMPLLGVTEPR